MWSFLIDGTIYGPYDIPQIAQFISEKRIAANTPAWTNGMTEWITAGKIAELSYLFHKSNSPYVNAQRRALPFYKRKSFIITAAIILIFIIGIILLSKGSDTKNQELLLEKSYLETSQNVASSGGVIRIDDKASQLAGLELTVSSGAYDKDTVFKISTSPIKSHGFGALFTPISPLISIDNGQGFAKIPMTVKIPIKKTDDEFAMAFYYDGKTGELEGIPFLREDNTSITLFTAHFSDIVVTKVKKSILDGQILKDKADTDFLPGMNDFVAKNYGSIVSLGHCMGQSLSMIHYFHMNKGTGKTLRTDQRIDNNNRNATLGLWQDDSLAYRLCSRVQTEYGNRWMGNNSAYETSRDKDDEITFYSFAYAMALTKSPQIMNLYNFKTNTGHAVVAYEVAPGYISVADPNYPGNTTCSIKVVREQAGSKMKIVLQPYTSAENALSQSVDYEMISYYGTYALIEHDIMDNLWEDVLQGKDVGAELFPPDAQFFVTICDSSGKSTSIPFADGFAVTSAETKQVDPDAVGKIFIHIIPMTQNTIYDLYMGADFIKTYTGVGQFIGKVVEIDLKPGDNDIGILYTKKDANDELKYVNFYRFKVKYTVVNEVVENVELEGDWNLQFKVDKYIVSKEDLDGYMSTLAEAYPIFKNDKGLYELSPDIPFNVDGTKISYSFDAFGGEYHWVFVGTLDKSTMTITGDFQAQNENNEYFIQGKWTAQKKELFAKLRTGHWGASITTLSNP